VSRWRLDPLSLRVLWGAFGHEMLPFPLRWRPVGLSPDDYDRALRETAHAMRARMNRDLYDAIATVSAPEARVELFGQIQGRMVRATGAVRGSDATLLVQEPGPTPDCGGAVQVSMFQLYRIGDEVAELLPPLRGGPVRKLDVTETEFLCGADDSDDDMPDSWSQPAMGRSTPRTTPPAQQLRTLLSRPRLGTVAVGVHPGPDREPAKRTTGYQWDWADFEDGRYMVHANGKVVGIESQDRAAMSEQTFRLVTSMLDRYRGR
jgi:hypothetical protein